MKSDGTEAGTTLVKDIFPGSASSREGGGLNSSSPSNLTNVNGTLYFSANTAGSDRDRELWKSDGTEAGTTLVKNINFNPPLPYSSNPSNLTNFNGALYFTADDNKRTGLWKSDGTEAGTTLVKYIHSTNYNPSNPYKLTLINVNSTLYLAGNDGSNGWELWRSDGAEAGSNGWELWRSDGTEAGTTLVKDIRAGSNGSELQNLINVNETLYFSANDGTNGTELWKFDTPSKNQNDAPFSANAIPNQIALEDEAFTYQFDANTFNDYDAGDTLSYSATLENNNSLPSWLTFDAATRTFSGTPSNSDLGNLSIKVTATDSLGASVSDIFNLLTAPSGSLNGDGLQAEYYDNSYFAGPSITRINPTVDYSWGREAPTTGIEPDTFSVRWTGQVQAQYSEDYTFYTQSDDGVRLWVNDQLLIDNWTEHGLTEDNGTISLVAGQEYNIRMEYYNSGADATAKLGWSSPSTPKAVIPQAQLYSNNQTNNVAIGTALQSGPEGELIDLRPQVDQTVEATVSASREGDFNNVVGFYPVLRESGTVVDPLSGQELTPADAGYAEAAMRLSQTSGLSFGVENTTLNFDLQGGVIYAPYLIANGTIDQVLNQDVNDDPDVFFNYKGANFLKFDHVKLLGPNQFGFEDLVRGGDQDFNDAVLKLDLQLA